MKHKNLVIDSALRDVKLLGYGLSEAFDQIDKTPPLSSGVVDCNDVHELKSKMLSGKERAYLRDFYNTGNLSNYSDLGFSKIKRNKLINSVKGKEFLMAIEEAEMRTVIFSKNEGLTLLSEMAYDPEMKAADRINAIKEISSQCGYKEAERSEQVLKFEMVGSVELIDSRTPAIVDVTEEDIIINESEDIDYE